jgi:hypothetical protein
MEKRTIKVREMDNELKEKMQAATDDVINLLADKYGMDREEMCLFFTIITEGFSDMGITIQALDKEQMKKFQEKLW